MSLHYSLKQISKAFVTVSCTFTGKIETFKINDILNLKFAFYTIAYYLLLFLVLSYFYSKTATDFDIFT